jgi:hypothetical protein
MAPMHNTITSLREPSNKGAHELQRATYRPLTSNFRPNQAKGSFSASTHHLDVEVALLIRRLSPGFVAFHVEPSAEIWPSCADSAISIPDPVAKWRVGSVQ